MDWVPEFPGHPVHALSCAYYIALLKIRKYCKNGKEKMRKNLHEKSWQRQVRKGY